MHRSCPQHACAARDMLFYLVSTYKLGSNFHCISNGGGKEGKNLSKFNSRMAFIKSASPRYHATVTNSYQSFMKTYYIDKKSSRSLFFLTMFDFPAIIFLQRYLKLEHFVWKFQFPTLSDGLYIHEHTYPQSLHSYR